MFRKSPLVALAVVALVSLCGSSCCTSILDICVFAFVSTSAKPRTQKPLFDSFSASPSPSLFRNSTIGMSPQTTDTESLQHFLDTVIDLQQEDAAIQLCQHENDGNTDDIPVNSIVFQLQAKQTNDHDDDDTALISPGFPETTTLSSVSSSSSPSPSYVLTVLASGDFVNTSRLENIVISRLGIETDERRSLLELAPSDRVEQLCGFAPGTVPPLGTSPTPLLTVVDEGLLHQSRHWMIGGGGIRGQSCRFRLDVLLGLNGVILANVREERTSQRLKSIGSSVSSLAGTSSVSPTSTSLSSSFTNTVKPFFPAETPPLDIATSVIAESNASNPLKPTELSLIGRIARVRRMARRLVSCDLVPPEIDMDVIDDTSAVSASALPLQHHWRSPVTGEDMSVQFIAGKTLCQQMGTQRGEVMLRKGLQVGQLVWIRGKTNVGNRESLRNWVDKQSMDIVAWDCTLLSPDAGFGAPTNSAPLSREPLFKHPKSVLTVRQPDEVCAFGFKEQPPLPPGMTYLRLQNLLSDQHEVVIVDSLEDVVTFKQDVTNLIAKDEDIIELTGLDCEWKPNFLLRSKSEEQPVLVLQVSLHSLRKVYLWDLQVLLRPLEDPNESRTALEQEVSEAFSTFFRSSRFVKLGFQLTNDLRRLAASYPNIAGFTHVEAVLELSKAARKSMYLSNQPKSRTVTSSLRNMVHWFLQCGLDKTEQVSDWSKRPLSGTQIEYAALDAAVAPILLERLMEPIQASLFARPLQIGRWLDDTAFYSAIQSWRFLFLEPTNNAAIRRLQAKSIVGDKVYVVSQSWRTGTALPPKPSVPTDDGPYTDSSGVFRIPAKLVELQPRWRINQVMDRFLGQHVAKTKDRCVAEVMQAIPSVSTELGNGARIDFAPRSGYVEFANGAILFVNMPMRPGARKAPSYPNEWLHSGQVLTWFLRESEWKGGSTPLARKLLSPEQPVYLFCRLGKGHFLCCGQCDISTDDNGDKRNWDLVKLYLTMLDFKRLHTSPAFVEMVHPGKYSYRDLCTPPDDAST